MFLLQKLFKKRKALCRWVLLATASSSDCLRAGGRAGLSLGYKRRLRCRTRQRGPKRLWVGDLVGYDCGFMTFPCHAHMFTSNKHPQKSEGCPQVRGRVQSLNLRPGQPIRWAVRGACWWACVRVLTAWLSRGQRAAGPGERCISAHRRGGTGEQAPPRAFGREGLRCRALAVQVREGVLVPVGWC